MKSNTLDIIILLAIVIVSFTVLIYIYYIYPKYGEYVYRQKLLYFFKKRYLLKNYELNSLLEAAQKNYIIPDYLIFTSRSALETAEKDILRSLKEYCPPEIAAHDALESLKERLTD